MPHDKFENHNVFVSNDRVKVISNRGRGFNFDKSLIYRVDYCDGDIATIHPVDNPSDKRDININRLDSHNWEIKEEGDVMRYYHRGAPVSQVPTNAFKHGFSQESAGNLFGYMIYEQPVKRCAKCKKNYRYIKDHFGLNRCIIDCDQKSCKKCSE